MCLNANTVGSGMFEFRQPLKSVCDNARPTVRPPWLQAALLPVLGWDYVDFLFRNFMGPGESNCWAPPAKGKSVSKKP